MLPPLSSLQLLQFYGLYQYNGSLQELGVQIASLQDVKSKLENRLNNLDQTKVSLEVCSAVLTACKLIAKCRCSSTSVDAKM